MGILEAFTTKNVLRASGIALLVPSAVLVIAPAIVVSQIFSKGDGENDKEDYLGRMSGIAGAGSALMMLAVPGRDVLHITIAQTLACTIVSGKRAKDADEAVAVDDKTNKVVTKVLFGLDACFLIALLLAKKNDDEQSGQPWHKVLP